MTAYRQVVDRPAAPKKPAPERAYRLDIQGLRGVAVLCVIAYHSSWSFVGGGYVGVDVFFVISGFLITSHLYDELSRTGRISLPHFYARRVRRLLVPAVVVIIATTALAWLYEPVLSVAQIAKDGAYSSIYFINYHLAARAVDYQHAGDAPSPFQHYWSLAVEEQYYLIWPLVLLTAALVFRRWSRRLAVGVVIGVIIAGSLALSIEMTPHSASLAYFSLQTRAWQLGIGAAIAIGLPWVRRLAPRPAAIATWLGVVMIVVSAVGYDDNTEFPGYLALVPVLGAALVIAGGAVAPSWGAVSFLSRQPLQFLGRVSYAWYLWHWPAVTIGPQILGHSVGAVGKTVLCLVALVFAWLTAILLEGPLLRTKARPARWLPTGAFASGCAVVASLVALQISPLHVTGAPAAAVELGARPEIALRTAVTRALDVQDVPRNLSPSLIKAAAAGRSACVTQLTDTVVRRCTFGDPSAAHTVVLFGDSHADQWAPALKELAVSRGWRLVVLARVGCPLANYLIYVDQLKSNYAECSRWRDGRIAEIAKMHPDLVVVSQSDTISSQAFSAPRWAQGTVDTVEKVAAVARRVVYLGDTPHPPINIPSCLAEHLTSASACNFADPTLPGSNSPNGVQAARGRDIADALKSSNVTYLPTAPWFCSGGTCPTIVGDVLMYRDDSHISSSAGRMLEPLLAPVLFPTS